MQNPWDVRPKAEKSDAGFAAIFFEVGRALTAWETLESFAADLFDAMVAAQPSNRAAHNAFIAVASSSARTQLLEAACERALPATDPARAEADDIIMQIRQFGARRNEIAHGRVYDLGEFGFQLGPNNTNPRKWAAGTAKYQYGSADIAFYAEQFIALARRTQAFEIELISRDIAARRTVAENSRRDERGTRT